MKFINLRTMEWYIKRLWVLNNHAFIYITTIVLAVVSASSIHSVMIEQSPIAYISVSNITLNFILLLGFWGYFTEWYAKKKKWGKKKSMVFWAVSTLIVFVLFRLCGMETIFG